MLDLYGGMAYTYLIISLIGEKIMIIKTIGDLRKLVEENEGEIKIGSIVITYKQNEDIDIHFDGSLIEYYNSGSASESNLIEEGSFSIMDSPSILREKNEKERKELRELKEEMEVKDKRFVENNLSLGKVEAYEKLLIGRDITISK